MRCEHYEGVHRHLNIARIRENNGHSMEDFAAMKLGEIVLIGIGIFILVLVLPVQQTDKAGQPALLNEVAIDVALSTAKTVARETLTEWEVRARQPLNGAWSGGGSGKEIVPGVRFGEGSGGGTGGFGGGSAAAPRPSMTPEKGQAPRSIDGIYIPQHIKTATPTAWELDMQATYEAGERTW